MVIEAREPLEEAKIVQILAGINRSSSRNRCATGCSSACPKSARLPPARADVIAEEQYSAGGTANKTIAHHASSAIFRSSFKRHRLATISRAALSACRLDSARKACCRRASPATVRFCPCRSSSSRADTHRRFSPAARSTSRITSRARSPASSARLPGSTDEITTPPVRVEAQFLARSALRSLTCSPNGETVPRSGFSIFCF